MNANMWTESGNILIRKEAYFYASITHTVGESSNLAIFSNVQSNHSIVPNKNLVQNIGFDGSGTHTNFEIDSYSLPTEELDLNIIHPDFVIANTNADEKAFQNFYNVKLSKKKIFLKKLFDKKFRELVF